jgi:ATP-dependent Clp protease ATP-binding subunit ClpA
MAFVSWQADVKLSKEAQFVLHIAGRKAEEYVHASYGAPHLLWALLNKEIPTYQLVRDLGKDIFYLQEWASVRLEEYPKANTTVSNAAAAQELTELLNEADQLRFELEGDEVDAACLLAVICIPGLVFSYDQLKTFSLSKDEVLQGAYGDLEVITANGNGVQKNGKQATNGASLSSDTSSSDSSDSGSVLEQYCRDKHREVAEREYFELVERKDEINTSLEVLSRYAKANLIITGEPGVGKTALIDGLAERLGKENGPDNLRNARLLELDMAAMQAGASYKGELEDRFQKIITELKKLEEPVLVIENIHALLDKQKNFSSLASLLIMELNRGQLTVIGTTTPENFRKTIEKDETFRRRFETLTLEEPGDKDTAAIIRTVITPHQHHHNLQIDDDTIEEAIRLSKRYDKERRLPDAAIDLIDRGMARLRISLNKSRMLFEELKEVSEENENDEAEGEPADVSNVRKKYDSFNEAAAGVLKNNYGITLLQVDKIDDGENEIIPLELTSSDEDDNPESLLEDKNVDCKNDFQHHVNNLISEMDALQWDEPVNIIQADLAAIISRKTGIPTGKIQTQERKRLLGMEDVLRERVVAQDGALKSVSEAVLESRSGLMKGGQPIGSFFFLGPTGTGKTELAKALSEFLFQDEQAMIRFDMSEFKEEHSAALLHGAPPGYVGYEEGGMLVNKIREKPYSVVLFDEIEKAHASVFDIFLQILDEGKLNDRLGKEGDFSNAVILFTSNIASEHITNVFEEKNRLPSSQNLMDKMAGHFRPEFLGRLTEIVPFAPISEEVLLRIFEIHLAELLQAATDKGVQVELDTETKSHLAQMGYSPQYGARPLKGVIRDKIRRPLSRMLIDGRIENGSRVQLSLDNDNEPQWNIN